ncbi:MAG: hypothetical protein P1P85_05465 [Patescibacteria group bacterium]|nr:hypothetical protein [Patescibacteria group bacterium]
METEQIKKDVELVLYENQEITVSNKEEYSRAGDILKLVKNKIKQIEDKRTEYTKPLLDQKKKIDTDFKNMQKPLIELTNKINSVMVKWNIEEQRRLNAEQKRIEEEALKKAKEEGISEVEVAVVNEGLKSSKGDIATSTMVETYDFEIVNEEKIPREFLQPDEVKIGRAIREAKGKIKIEGIKILISNKIKSR